ncbi:MAG TPA: hypothetical protein VM223_19550, partial [Planctomycetota bacterium]|nr:hypothetical protein [Planctomycetota bacterium]
MKKELVSLLLVLLLLGSYAFGEATLSGPLPAGWLTDLLQLGDTPCARISYGSVGTDYLTSIGGEANAIPMPGMTMVGIPGATPDPLVWTPMYDGDGIWGNCADNYVMYWCVYVTSPDERVVRFTYNRDDEIRIWLNGALVVSAGCCGEASTDTTLAAGTNRIMIKLGEGGADDLMQLKITNTDGSAIDGATYALSPGPYFTSFKLFDSTSGSEVLTDVAEITVELVAGLATQYQITESDVGPATWLDEPPTTYTITTGEGDKTIYAWIKDANGTVNSTSTTILFSTLTPVISDVTTESTGSTITVTWATDAACVGWLEYGVQGEPLSGVSGRGEFGTFHSITIAELLDGTAYDIKVNAAGSSVRTTVVTTATEPTPDNVTWAGRADTDGWERGSNWLGFQQPTNPTDGTVTFTTAGTAPDGVITNTLDEDRDIGGLIVQHTTDTHTMEM